jgi:hypothetical protein
MVADWSNHVSYLLWQGCITAAKDYILFDVRTIDLVHATNDICSK